MQRVAENLGYDSPSAFITMFKKALGKPPRKYFADDRQHDTAASRRRRLNAARLKGTFIDMGADG
ncbi:hypothetical protein [Sodalis glossinidius]|uniref:helix-turn-helix domain-containing protein n=1 Tax=Sodalis glossinidius TaxID=63612 RepID=UPI00311E14BE